MPTMPHDGDKKNGGKKIFCRVVTGVPMVKILKSGGIARKT